MSWKVVVEIEGSAPEQFEIKIERVGVGRAEDNALRIRRLGVAKHHAELYTRGDSLWIKDAGEAGGTWVDGVRLVEPTQLHPGASIRLTDEVHLLVTGGFARTCPECFSAVAEHAWMCPSCEFVLDADGLRTNLTGQPRINDTIPAQKATPDAAALLVVQVNLQTINEFDGLKRSVTDTYRHTAVELTSLFDSLFVEQHALERSFPRPHAGRRGPTNADLGDAAWADNPLKHATSKAAPLGARGALAYADAPALAASGDRLFIAAQGDVIAVDAAGAEIGRSWLDLRDKDAEAHSLVLAGDRLFALSATSFGILHAIDATSMEVGARIELERIPGRPVAQWIDEGASRWNVVLSAASGQEILQFDLEQPNVPARIRVEGLEILAISRRAPAWAIVRRGDRVGLAKADGARFEPVEGLDLEGGGYEKVAAIATVKGRLIAVLDRAAYLVRDPARGFVSARAPIHVDTADPGCRVVSFTAW